MNIEMGKKYQTRGRPGHSAPVRARVLCVDGPGSMPVVALIETDGPDWIATKHTASGGYSITGDPSELDLIPAPEKVKVDFVVSVYPFGSVHTDLTDGLAKRNAESDIIARRRIQFEVEKGEGLTDEERARLKV